MLWSRTAGRGCLLDPPDVEFRRVKSLDHAYQAASARPYLARRTAMDRHEAEREE